MKPSQDGGFSSRRTGSAHPGARSPRPTQMLCPCAQSRVTGGGEAGQVTRGERVVDALMVAAWPWQRDGALGGEPLGRGQDSRFVRRGSVNRRALRLRDCRFADRVRVAPPAWNSAERELANPLGQHWIRMSASPSGSRPRITRRSRSGASVAHAWGLHAVGYSTGNRVRSLAYPANVSGHR
jgi:hypothetical protein